jgi:hypothetical protein
MPLTNVVIMPGQCIVVEARDSAASSAISLKGLVVKNVVAYSTSAPTLSTSNTDIVPLLRPVKSERVYFTAKDSEHPGSLSLSGAVLVR